MSDDPDLPFGHNTLKIRAMFVPDGADVSMANIIQAVGPRPVMIRAVRVPPGGALPGYPYEHIGQAVFIPDSDARNTPAFTSRQNPPRMSASGAASLSIPSRTDDSRAQEGNALDGRRWSGSPLASTAGPWAPAPNPPGGGGSSGGLAPRRGVRSAQTNFSAAVPTPHVDVSRDAIDAAVRAVSIEPADWGHENAASPAAPAIGPALAPLQLSADLIRATTSGSRPVAPSDPRPNRLVADKAPEQLPGTADVAAPPPEQGVAVVLPDGSTIPDTHSPTGHLMSPVADLAPVAAAGRRARRTYQAMLRSPKTMAGALPLFAIDTLMHIGHGGSFDYQRRGDHLTGFKQLRHFRDVSNFNVGLYCQQAGLSREDTLIAAGYFARVFSSNAKPDQPYGLAPPTREFIEAGYQAGQSGAFDLPLSPK